MKNCAVILAGGEGTRMHSEKPKVMAELMFKPMIDHVFDAAKKAGIDDICVVTGYQAHILEAHLQGRAHTVRQTERLGTGHAVMQAADYLRENDFDNVLILNGDAPFMDSRTIAEALDYHLRKGFVQTVISAKIENPFGYGRIVRDFNGDFSAIVEEASADKETKKINEINSGAMWFQKEKLLYLLSKITNDNSKGEYYLTDTVGIAVAQKLRVGAYTAKNPDAVLGANNRVQLNELGEVMRRKILERVMLSGVSIPCTDGVIIDDGAVIGTDTVILPGTIIKTGCEIGKHCVIGPNTVLYKTRVGNGSKLNQVQAEEAEVGENCDLGPFVHLRPNTRLDEGVHCGNFVEVKNSTVGAGTKVSHLTYVGDSDVGKKVNFGCGVVTVNYNGKTKNRCRVGDGAFLGCNTNLIAPVSVGERAYTAAGSTVTEDVPDYALAIARSRQTNKPGWVIKKKPYKDQ